MLVSEGNGASLIIWTKGSRLLLHDEMTHSHEHCWRDPIAVQAAKAAVVALLFRTKIGCNSFSKGCTAVAGQL